MRDKSSFTLNFHAAGCNVFEALNGFRFQEAMSRGGTFTIESLKTGVHFGRQRIEAGKHAAADPKWVELLEISLFIQQQTGFLLKCPEAVSYDEAQNIFAIREILNGGRAQMVAVPWETKPLNRQEAEKLLEDLESSAPKELVVNYNPNDTIAIFGSNLPLGPVVISCNSACLAKEDVSALRAALGVPPSDEEFFMRVLHLSEGVVFDAAYLDWLPTSEKAAILRSPIFRARTLQTAAKLLWDSTTQAGNTNMAAFVQAIAEACVDVPREEETLLNPFSEMAEGDLQIALAPIFDDLDREARAELASRLVNFNLLSVELVSDLAGITAEDIQSALKAMTQTAS